MFSLHKGFLRYECTTLFCYLSAELFLISALSIRLSSFFYLLCLSAVKPHRPTAFHSSFFCRSHSSISLCTLHLLYISSCLCRPFRWSHGGSPLMTRGLFSRKHCVLSRNAIPLQRKTADGEAEKEGSKLRLCARKSRPTFLKAAFES